MEEDPSKTGDEPLLIARSLPGVPVLVGKDRRKSGARAIARFDPACLVLDDGMQYWQLFRDLNIALLDARHPFENGLCLPAGFLREPPTALQRAAIIVMTRCDALQPQELVDVYQKVAQYAPHARLFSSVHSICGFDIVHGTMSGRSIEDPDRKIFCFCGIAQPESFFSAVALRLSGEMVDAEPLEDHVEYSNGILENLLIRARAAGADLIITTEKDAMKLTRWDAEIPLAAAKMRIKIDNEEELVACIGKQIGMCLEEAQT